MAVTFGPKPHIWSYQIEMWLPYLVPPCHIMSASGPNMDAIFSPGPNVTATFGLGPNVATVQLTSYIACIF